VRAVSSLDLEAAARDVKALRLLIYRSPHDYGMKPGEVADQLEAAIGEIAALRAQVERRGKLLGEIYLSFRSEGEVVCYTIADELDWIARRDAACQKAGE
jgi:Asp-tRNA(Asn)/Glu-tRNA(Gln) amidotransferase A subunit family amidase